MDFQYAFNIAVAMVGGLGGWILRVIWEAQNKLREDMSKIERQLPETYARRDDFKDVIKEINSRFDNMEALIQQLAKGAK